MFMDGIINMWFFVKNSENTNVVCEIKTGDTRAVYMLFLYIIAEAASVMLIVDPHGIA